MDRITSQTYRNLLAKIPAVVISGAYGAIEKKIKQVSVKCHNKSVITNKYYPMFWNCLASISWGVSYQSVLAIMACCAPTASLQRKMSKGAP